MSGNWMEKYGPIVGLIVGSAPVVAVAGPHEVMEVLRRDEFQGRQDDDHIRERNFNKRLGEFILRCVVRLVPCLFLDVKTRWAVVSIYQIKEDETIKIYST
jgi:hypothetical protein